MHKTQGYFEEDINQMNIAPKRLGFSILIREHSHKAKSTIRDKEDHYKMIEQFNMKP